ncbi:MAG: triphosphoribosyl-dephospho-CoA synthase [Gammaproteobacteria bacterium]|nr:triphosphoribosyl-dephospho-CoA synthase [Gammaproteobacteria bacterium]
MASLIGEVDALKPGNVHRLAGGHGMRYEDFLTSARVCAPLLCETGTAVGARVLGCVRATQMAVGTNTNLGMLLLFAPLIRSAEIVSAPSKLRDGVLQVLAALQQSDAEEVYAAIRLARPGGLGRVRRYDVQSGPKCGLVAAMEAAADRDRVARQYASGFADIFSLGLNWLREFQGRWNSVEWATAGCFLRFLAQFPDSHIQRKFGPETAEHVRQRSEPLLRRFEKNKNPASSVKMLLEFDKELKDARINPGTSADLTAASLLVFYLNARAGI